MLLFVAGFALGDALAVVVYHFYILQQLKTYAVDWRARAISAEQEVENWKVWAKAKGVVRGY
ncbi:MAG TPA: hypothetical protein VE077_17710 [Candidatus Methylomirabilis sp.]|nr:hypothetical protein [Candidatus Methylomirabilis sp.]